MRAPDRTLAGNLRWTRHGTVWADFLLQPVPYGFRPLKDKQAARSLHQALFRALPGESLLLGVCAGLDPAAVVERMIAGIDLSTCPEWAAEAEATWDTLAAIGPGQRLYWLSVPLGETSTNARLTEPFKAAFADLKDTLGLPRAAAGSEETARRMDQAAKIAAGIPAPFRPRPATPAQMLWLTLHAQQRGLFLDLDAPDPDGGDPELADHLLTPRGGASLPEPLLDEGGQSDLDRRQLRTWNPLERRFLKVLQADRPDTPPASYQALLVLTDTPSEATFPGSEFLGRIDECGLDVDWAMRLHVLSSDQVSKRNRKALVNLNEQYSQREGELSHGITQLDRAATDLSDYVAALDADALEVETQATFIFAVGAADPDDAQAQARHMTNYLGSAQYRLTTPLGYQTELWWAMQPGVPAGKVVREYAQITTSKVLATTVPLASAELGDRRGPLLGLNISTGRPGVVLHDMAGAAHRDVSGSLGVAGELGSGKALAVDTPIPTPAGWTRMGELLPGELVFDDQGNPTRVVAMSEVMTGRDCCEVQFSDGSVITADAEHLWTTLPDRVRSNAAKRNWKSRQRSGTAAVIDLTARAEALTGADWPACGHTATTRQIGDTLLRGVQANHAIPTCAPLRLPTATVPIDPYVLGAWLGDGTSSGNGFTTADPELLTFIEAAGYLVKPASGRYHYSINLPRDPGDVRVREIRACAWCGTEYVAAYAHRRYCGRTCAIQAIHTGQAPPVVWTCPGCGAAMTSSSTGRRCRSCRDASTFTGQLRALGVRGHKHIPGLYLRASIAQRRALLAGLLDTDGTVAKNGAVEYTTTTSELAHDVFELVTSLGYRATLRTGTAHLNGKACGAKYTVAWSTSDDVFWLTRKRHQHQARRRTTSPIRRRLRYIVAVRAVPSVPVRCIQVAADSQLYLAGPAMIPTHNSSLLKSLAGATVDRGGRVIVTDRTAMGEYEVWAKAVTAATVVNVADPVVSLDPLRLFGPKTGSRVAQSFLTPLLDIAPTSVEGVLLSEVLDPLYLADHGIEGLGGLVAHMASPACVVPGAVDVARTMNVFAKRDFGRVIFDDQLPPLPLDTPAIVIRTHTLDLPSRSELEHEHLFKQLRLEKVFGRATYALIAALARQVCFTDPSVLGAFVVDEAHHLTSSPEGEREIIDFVRDGRKHGAAVMLGSHDPEADFGSATLRGLIPTRILMRHRDRTLAKRGLRWLDLDADDDDLVELLTEHTAPVGPSGVPEQRRGEAFMRDASGSIGRIRVLLPSLPARNQAARTTPPDTSEQS